MSRRLLLWAPPLLLLLYEIYLSSQSVLPSFPIHFSQIDKLEHAAYFFLMTTFAYRALRFGEGWGRAAAAAAISCGALAYGALDEWHQSFVPFRDVDPWDVVADTTGAIVAAIVSERLWACFERPAG